MRCDFCKHRNCDGHDEPCLYCVECGVPYVEDVPGELTDNFEPVKETN